MDTLKKFVCNPPKTDEEIRIEHRALRMATFVTMTYIRWLAENVPEGTKLINIYTGEWKDKYKEYWDSESTKVSTVHG